MFTAVYCELILCLIFYSAEKKPVNQASVLQKLPVRVTPQDVCINAYLNHGGPDDRPFHITPNHICSVSKRGEGTGFCKYDDGGPLQCRVPGRGYVLAGAMSFNKYCGSATYPDVSSRITEVLDWISKTTGIHVDHF